MGKLLGTRIAQAIGPEQLRGKIISLNLKKCKWFVPPSEDSRLMVTAKNPTIEIPDSARKEDLECILLKLKAKHFVIGPTPIPEHTKQPDALKRHTNMVLEYFDKDIVKDHVKKIVNGPNLDGGYSKLEILQEMLGIEEVNPATGRGGRNRREVVDFIREAISYVEEVYGGVSKVHKEEFIPAQDGSSLRERPQAAVNKETVNQFLGIDD